MQKTLILIGAALILLVPSIAESANTNQKQNPPYGVTCDEFIGRLKNAERALGIPIPKPDHDFADMTESSLGDLTSGAAYINPALKTDDHVATLFCTKGKTFEEFQLNAPPDTANDRLSNTRLTSLIVAALYAYTGWPTKRVLAAQRQLLSETRSNLIRGEGEAELKLPAQGVARLSFDDGGAQLLITLEKGE